MKTYIGKYRAGLTWRMFTAEQLDSLQDAGHEIIRFKGLNCT